MKHDVVKNAGGDSNRSSALNNREDGLNSTADHLPLPPLTAEQRDAARSIPSLSAGPA